MAARPYRDVDFDRSPGGDAAITPADSRAALRRTRNYWFGGAVVFFLLGCWGLIAWQFGLPLGGEIRANPFDESPWRLSNAAELVFKTMPHRAFGNMPVLPAGMIGLLAERGMPDEFYNAPATAIVEVRRTKPTAAAARGLDLPGISLAQAASIDRPIGVDESLVAAFFRSAFSRSSGDEMVAVDLDGTIFISSDKGTTWRIEDAKQRGGELPRDFRIDEIEAAVWLLVPYKSFNASHAFLSADRTVFGRPVESPNVKFLPVVEADSFLDFELFVSHSVGVNLKLGSLSDSDERRGTYPSPSAFAFPTGFRILRAAEASDAVGFHFLTSGRDQLGEDVNWVTGDTGTIVKIAQESEPVFPGLKNSYGTQIQPTPTGAPLRSLFFQSPTIGWASSGWNNNDLENTPRPVILQTLDAGETWSYLPYRQFPAPWVYFAFLFAVLPFERGTRAHLRYLQTAERARIAEHGVSDNPIGLDDPDALGLTPIARAMSRFLRNIQTKPTVAIGVTGAWGSGKSSLMNVVREDLSDRGIQAVWFNAWHHQKEDSLLAALLVAIREQAVPPLWTPFGLRVRIRLAWRRAGHNLIRVLVAITLVATAAWLLVTYGRDILDALEGLYKALFGSSTQDDPAGAPADTVAASGTTPDPSSEEKKPTDTKDDFWTGLLAISGGAAGTATIVFQAARFVMSFKPFQASPTDLLASLSDRSRDKEIDDQLSFRHRFKREFEIFCACLRTRRHPGLVIFVDDLDRCASDQTVDVLEAINFVTTAGSCFVVLGFDEAKVTAAIADVYKDTLLELNEQAVGKVEEASRPDLFRFATNYLEKLVQLVIPVPRSQDGTVEKLMGLTPLPRPSSSARRWRNARRIAREIVITLLILGVAGLAAWSLGSVAWRTFPSASAPFAADSQKKPTRATLANPSPGVDSSVPVEPTAGADSLPVVELPRVEVADLVTLPFWAPPLVGFLAISLIGLVFVPRFFSEAVVDDSADFREALKIWAPVIGRRRETPRAVKRFVNRLRFLAMRVRDIDTEARLQGTRSPIDEPALVTLAAIEEVDESRFDQAGVRRGAHGDLAQAILEGLQKFGQQFTRKAEIDPSALDIYRAIAGIVEDRSGGEASAKRGAKAKTKLKSAQRSKRTGPKSKPKSKPAPAAK